VTESSIFAHQFAEPVATPRQTRAHRPDWPTEDLRDTLIVHAFKAYEQEYLALLRKKPGKRLGPGVSLG